MYAIAEKPLKSVIVFGSTSSPWKPRSTGPGANTWISGPSGIWMPPGIGFGSEPTAVAVPENDKKVTVAATSKVTENRALTSPPSPRYVRDSWQTWPASAERCLLSSHAQILVSPRLHKTTTPMSSSAPTDRDTPTMRHTPSWNEEQPLSMPESWRRQRWPLRILRAFLGGTFVYAGIQKLGDPNFLHAGTPDYIGSQLQAFAQGSPIRPLLAVASHLPVLTG